MQARKLNADIEAVFGIELAAEAGPQVDTDTGKLWQDIRCDKCQGSGNFTGYTGRVVGKCFACDGKGVKRKVLEPERKAAVNVDKIIAAFATAFGNGLKRPKLRIGTFTFSRAPDTGKNAGALYVKDGDDYLGKIIAGEFFPVRSCGDDRMAQVLAASCDPLEAAKAHGKRTGSCSCCGRELTNKVSIEMGIGPICAQKFGW